MTGDPQAPHVIFGVLGTLELPDVAPATRPRGKQAVLLSLLLLRANAWVDTDEIVDALWSVGPPMSAERNVKTYVWQLRRVLPDLPGGEARLQGRRGGYRIVVATDELDAGRLERAVAADDADADALLAVLAMWRGRPFAELSEDTTRVATARLEQLRWQLRERLADALADAGRPAEVIALLLPLTAEDPLREGLWARLVQALTASGRRAEALAAYQQARRALVDELGVEPGPALQEAQRRALVGAAAIAPMAATVPSYLPRAVADFTGRRDDAQALLSHCDDGPTEAARIAVVEGMPGVGKTTLAVHVAHRIAEQYPDGQVFCDLHGHDQDAPPARPSDILHGLLQAFGVPASSIPEGMEARSGLWRSLLRGRRVLLVLDDAASAAQVGPLLPGSSGSFTMITSRRRLCGLDGVGSVGLAPLPDADAAQLLLGSRHRPDDALSLVRLCGNLPLALRAAASRLRQRPSWDAGALAERLRCPATRLDELRTGEHDLAAVFATSYERLSGEGQRLFRMLATGCATQVCGTCPRQATEAAVELTGTQIAARAGLPAGRVERALDELLEHHLAIQCAGGRYRTHPLLRAFGQTVTEPAVDHDDGIGGLVPVARTA